MSLLQVGARLRRRAGVPADPDPLDQKIPRRVPLSAGHHHSRVGVSLQALNFTTILSCFVATKSRLIALQAIQQMVFNASKQDGTVVNH